MSKEMYYNVSHEDRLINCPYCGFKITVMWSTLANCLESTCSSCEGIFMKVFNPVGCLGCVSNCIRYKVIMRTSGKINVK